MAESERLKVPLTVRKMRDGSLELFVGEQQIAGFPSVSIVDDGKDSVVTVQLDTVDVFLDSERPAPHTLNS